MMLLMPMGRKSRRVGSSGVDVLGMRMVSKLSQSCGIVAFSKQVLKRDARMDGRSVVSLSILRMLIERLSGPGVLWRSWFRMRLRTSSLVVKLKSSGVGGT